MRYESDVISKNIIRKQKIKKVFIVLLYMMLIPLILFSLLLILLELGNSRELPSFLNIEMYMVTSDSMKPRLSIDDIVIVKKGYKPDEYKKGNIITFKINNKIITHRIERYSYDTGNLTYITKGDNNNVEDTDKVSYDMIIGKVIFSLSRTGFVLNVVKNKVFFISCIIFLILVILYDYKQKKKIMERKLVREKYEKKSDFYF